MIKSEQVFWYNTQLFNWKMWQRFEYSNPEYAEWYLTDYLRIQKFLKEEL